MNDISEKKIEVLLSEYHACHRTRDAYAKIRWSVGSIILATSLGLVGISFSFEKFSILIGMAISSLAFLLIWILYNQNISIYTMASIFRMHEIEVELRKQFDVKLHKSIHETPKRRGLHTTILFYGTVFLAWGIRFIIFGLTAQSLWYFYPISIILIFIPLIVVIWWLKRSFPNYVLMINNLLLKEKKAKERAREG